MRWERDSDAKRIAERKCLFLPFSQMCFFKRTKIFLSNFKRFFGNAFYFCRVRRQGLFRYIQIKYLLYTIQIFICRPRLYELPFFNFCRFRYCINAQKVVLYMHNNSFIYKSMHNYPIEMLSQTVFGFVESRISDGVRR